MRVLQETGVLRQRCEQCGCPVHDAMPPRDYAYLLGIYLGDGCLGSAGRTVALRITLDAAYPRIVDEVADAIVSVRGGGRVSRYEPSDERSVVLTSYTRAWRCIFPQHGAGPKHRRRIMLEPWQNAIVRAHAGPFARGLIHSDGWRGVNRVRVKGRGYEYPRYQFSNRSADIRTLFTRALDELGVAWRPWGQYHVSVARRSAVALLDQYVGRKS